jgi:hypothetical protein
MKCSMQDHSLPEYKDEMSMLRMRSVITADIDDCITFKENWFS